MTFSILAVDPTTGEAGYAQSTSTPAVADRCTGVVLGKGVVTVQSSGDFRQRELAMRLMEQGHAPEQVLAALRPDKYFDRRQVAIIDLSGNTAVNTGERRSPWAGEIVGPNHIATGNTLAGPAVIEAMSEAFMASAGEPFHERLMRSLEAGRDAGGQPDGQSSSALKVFTLRHPLVNLRVDVHPEPVGHLRHIYDWYKNLLPYYLEKALDYDCWNGDTWHAMEESGVPLLPPSASDWTPEIIERRVDQIRKAPTTRAGKAPVGS